MRPIKPLSAICLAGLGVALYVHIDGINVINSYGVYEKPSVVDSYIFHSLLDGQNNNLNSVDTEKISLPLEEIEHKGLPIEPSSNSLNNESVINELTKVVCVTVKRGDSLIKLLRANGLSGSETTSIIYRSGIPSPSFKIEISNEIRISKDQSGVIEWIEIHNTPEGYTRISRENNDWSHKHLEYEIEKQQEVFEFNLESALFNDAKAVGMQDSEIVKLQNIFKDTVNFSRLHAGDSFSVLLERSYKNGRASGGSTVLAAKINTLATVHTAYRYDENGESGYFDNNGDSLMPSFRKHPVDNVRVTSHFNPYRKHPVLDIVRPHRGTDYGGAGKPIKALGDGVIKFAGKRGAFGNVVIINHGDGIKTLSAHQARFEKGISTGKRVSKGDVIGYIGSTGLVTGPHLHFELHVNGKHVDPLSYPLPVSSKVSDKESFNAKVLGLNGSFGSLTRSLVKSS